MRKERKEKREKKRKEAKEATKERKEKAKEATKERKEKAKEATKERKEKRDTKRKAAREARNQLKKEENKPDFVLFNNNNNVSNINNNVSNIDFNNNNVSNIDNDELERLENEMANEIANEKNEHGLYLKDETRSSNFDTQEEKDEEGYEFQRLDNIMENKPILGKKWRENKEIEKKITNFTKDIGGKTRKTKKVRKHKGIHQTGGNKGRLKKGYKYSGKKLKNGKSEIIKCKSKKC